ncbi:hypothetical protein GCM10010232_48620 [Streptomyces amakusaensis]
MWLVRSRSRCPFSTIDRYPVDSPDRSANARRLIPCRNLRDFTARPMTAARAPSAPFTPNPRSLQSEPSR